MPQKLWVECQTTEETFGPTKVSIDGCIDVDDFKFAIRNNPELAIPQNTPITLYQPGGNVEIDVGLAITPFIAGNSRATPLVVKQIETAASRKRVKFEEEVLARLDSLEPVVSDFVRRYYYTNDKATKAEKRDPEFKKKLIKYYFGKETAVSSVMCMLTKTELPTRTVIAAHLFKSCWQGDCKERLDFDDINDSRNGLLWFMPLEHAFDNSHICYHFDVASETFRMKILDSRLRELTFREYIEKENELDSGLLLRTRDQWQTEFSQNPNETQEGIAEKMKAVDSLLILLDQKIGSFEGKELLATEKKCYSRCLSFQASMARILAIRNGWISREEPDSPGKFSDLDEKRKNQVYTWLKNAKGSATDPIHD